MHTPTPVSRRLIEAALDAAATRGWRRLALADIARAAGVSLGEAYDAYPSKTALLWDLVGLHDRAVLGAGAASGDDGPRDRLFEVVMRRFDSLQSHRNGMRAILRDVVRDPLAVAALAPALLRSIRWTLEAAGLRADDPAAPLRGIGLTLVYLNALRAWSDDDSADMARTMAALDRGLREAESVATRCPLLAGTANAPAAPQGRQQHAPGTPDTSAA